MAILKPVVESQVEISLSRDDGSMRYDRSFTAISELIAHRFGAEVTYDPITIESVFDPIFHKDLLAYCVDAFKNPEKHGETFTLVLSMRHSHGSEQGTRAQYEITGCQLIGFSFPKFDRNVGDAAKFKLCFRPSGLSKLLT
jgi:hypothetical protein